jgi:hypothetical protein
LKNLYIDPITKDLAITDFNLQLTANSNENLAQKVETRLNTFAGEWFLNVELGVPYYQRILKKNPNYADVNSLLLSIVASTPGVESVEAFAVKFETSTRDYRVEFTAKSAYGGTITQAVSI